MKLSSHTTGPDDAPRLLIVHGLFGSGRNWGVLQKRLSDAYRVTVVDMRNHGASDWDDSHDYGDLAGDLADTMDAPSHVLGHSMGGKAAMVLAVTRPDLVHKLVVADIAPVAYGHSQMHLIDAMRALDTDVDSRRDADRRFADLVDEPGVRAFLLQSLDISNRRWKLNLDALATAMDRITGWPEDLSGQFEGPALFLSGSRSDYVTREMRPQIRAFFPKARFAAIPDAGHWLHAEKPRETEAAVRTFLGD